MLDTITNMSTPQFMTLLFGGVAICGVLRIVLRK